MSKIYQIVGDTIIVDTAKDLAKITTFIDVDDYKIEILFS